MSTATTIKVHPVANWLLISPRAVVSEVTKMGLFKVDMSDEKPQTGVILAVGPDVKEPLVPGTLVVYGKFVGTELNLDDYEAVLLQSLDILAVLELVEAEVEDDAPAPDAAPLIELATR